MENVFIKALENEKKKVNSMQGNWGLSQVNRLSNILEEKGIYISESLWDLLIFNVQELYCNDGKISVVWRLNQQSKKVIKLIQKNYELIIDNYNYIMAGN